MKTTNSKKKLGLDFGKVILGATVNGHADTSFLGTSFDDAMRTPASDGAVEAVANLVEAFSGRVWIVSKCGPTVQNKTLGWLKQSLFYRQTGLKRENVRFCLKRNQKTPICKQLGITHFVDDRLDVMNTMLGIVPHLYLFGEQPLDQTYPAAITPTADWAAVQREMIGSSGKV